MSAGAGGLSKMPQAVYLCTEVFVPVLWDMLALDQAPDPTLSIWGNQQVIIPPVTGAPSSGGPKQAHVLSVHISMHDFSNFPEHLQTMGSGVRRHLRGHG